MNADQSKSTLELPRREPGPLFLRKFEEPITEDDSIGCLPVAVAIYFGALILIAILCS